MDLTNMFEIALLQFLKDTKVDLEKKGYVATLEKAIEELEERLNNK